MNGAGADGRTPAEGGAIDLRPWGARKLLPRTDPSLVDLEIMTTGTRTKMGERALGRMLLKQESGKR